MTKGRFELPCPKARRSERRVSSVPPLGQTSLPTQPVTLPAQQAVGDHLKGTNVSLTRIVQSLLCKSNTDWTHRELHPNLRFAGPASSSWTMSPSCRNAKPNSSTTPSHAPTCGSWNRTNASGFRARHRDQQRPSRNLFSIFNVLNSFLRKLRGQESNLHTRGSKPRISTSRNYPALSARNAKLLSKSIHLNQAEAVGLEPTSGKTTTCFRDRLLIRPDDFLNWGRKDSNLRRAD